jgi:MipA family protein
VFVGTIGFAAKGVAQVGLARENGAQFMMPEAISQIGATLIAIVWLAAPIYGKEEPLWEYGLGIGALGYEDYRGANTSHVYPVPVPYLVYNGPFFKADKDGLHGALFKHRWVELSLSFDATLPVSNDRTRSGTPELRPTVEAGISLDVHLWRSDDARAKIDFKVPVRQAFTLQSPPQPIGWTLTPGFKLNFADAFGHAAWEAGLFTGPLFANRHYDDYFYSVAPQNATASRPAYQATGGYAGTQFVADLTKRFPKYWVRAFVRYDTLAGAVFAESPLVRRENYWAAGIIFAWMIGRSSQMVEVAP